MQVVADAIPSTCEQVSKVTVSPAALLGITFKSCCSCTLQQRAPHVQVNHEDFNEGIIQVQAKKKANLSYYA